MLCQRKCACYKLLWNCYSCKRRGFLAELLEALTGKPINYCTKYVVKYVQRRTYNFEPKKKREVITDVPEKHRYFSPELMDRGFDIEVLRDWSIGYDPEEKAAVIYWRNREGDLVGYEYKYFKGFKRFQKEVDSGDYLFGEDRVNVLKLNLALQKLMK